MRKITLLFGLLFATMQINAQVWTINSCSNLGSSTYGPMYSTASANATNRTAVIYPSSQLTGISGQELTDMYFQRYSASGNIAGTPNFKIYLVEVAAADWGSGGLDWATTIAGATLVFDGDPATIVGTTSGWKGFSFLTNFTYSGTQNLAVLTEYTNASASSSITWNYEYTAPCSDTSNSNTTKYSNNTTGTLPTALSSSNYRRPLIGFDFTQTCPAPSNVSITNITATTADMSWTVNGSEADWEYVVQAAGTGAPTGSGTAIDSNPYTLGSVTALTSATDYEVYIRAFCSVSDQSVWIGPITFTTACATFPAPFYEPFATNAMPNCWTPGGATAWEFGSNVSTPVGFADYGADNVPDNSVGGGGTFIGMDGSDNTDGEVSTLTTPFIDVSGLTAPYLSYYVFSNNINDAAQNELLVEIWDGAAWSTIETIQANLGTSWVMFDSDLSTLTITGDVQVRFTVTGVANGGSTYYNDILIDDVRIDEMPTCIQPSDFTISNITDSTADISWTANNGELEWEYVLQAPGTGVPTAAGTSITTNPYTLGSVTALTPVTDYEVYFRAVCSTTDQSDWIGPFTFTTTCATYAAPYLEDFSTYTTAVTPDCWEEADNGDLTAGPATFGSSNWTPDGFGNNGTTGAARVEVWTTGLNDWIVSPMINIPATGYELKFLAGATQWNTTGAPTTPWETDDFVEVLISTTGYTNWTVLYTYNDTNTPSVVGDVNIIDLDAYAGQDVRFAFRAVEGSNNGSADINLYIDDFEVRLTPSCAEPTDLSISNITATTADFSWTANNGESDWEYVVQAAGTGLPTGSGTAIDANPYTLGSVTALTPATDYEVYIRAVCSFSDQSAWSGPVNFTTECATFTAPYNEPFATNSLPNCWEEGGATAWEYGSLNGTTPAGFAAYGAAAVADYNAAGGTFIGMDGSDNSDGEVSTLTSPFIDVTPLTVPRLKYAVFSNNTNDTAQNELLVEVWDGAAWNTVNTVQANLGPNWVVYTTDLTTLTITGDVQIRYTVTGVANGGSTFYNDILIDDVTIEETPTVAPTCATNVVGTPDPSCGNFENTLTWDAVSGADGYYLTIGTTSGGTDILNNQDVAGALTYSFLGTPGTNYYFTVVPYTGSLTATGCTEASFSTNTNGCYCTSEPTSVDADGITNVQVVATDFPNSVNSAPVYNDHTATVVDMSQGINNNVQITLSVASYTYNTVIWVDFNDDYNFDASEQVYSGSSSTGVLNASFVMPATAPLGQHRMRVISAWNVTPTECYSGSYAETADFTVNIVTASCTPATVASSTVVEDCANSQFSVDVDVTALGDGTPSITDGTTTWPIATASVVNVGPFASGSSVSLTVLHGSDTTCDLALGTFASTCPPANNDCAGAITLTPGAVFADNAVVGTNVGATDSVEIDPTCAYYQGGDVWYSVTVPASGSITIETAANSGSTLTDTGLAVFSGTCGSLTEIGCNDDTSGGFSLLSFTSLTPGDVLLISVWEYGGDVEDTFQVSAYDASLATNNFNVNEFTAYPNPVKDVLNLEYSSEITAVQVVNMLGQVVISKTINANATQVDMSDLRNGAYLVNVTSGDVQKTIKVIKQ